MAKIREKAVVFLFSFFVLGLSSFVPHPSSLAYAVVPHLISYQGRLTDTSGNPLTGSYAVTFRIYDAETAGSMLWEETHLGVVVDKGLFSVFLGGVVALNLPFDKPYFLEIKVGTEVMTPRQRIASAGYAMRAETANNVLTLNGKTDADFALASDLTSLPTPNKAVKLDANAKLPVGVLKTYDSGWVAISALSTITLNHNLGTTKIIYTIEFATSSDGSAGYYGVGALTSWRNNDQGETYNGLAASSLTVTSITIKMGHQLTTVQDGAGQTHTSGYCRVKMLALE